MLFRVSLALIIVLGVPFASFGQALRLQGKWLKTYDPSRSLTEEWLAFETNGALSIGNKDGVFLRCSYDGNREVITATCDVGGEKVKMDLSVAKEFEDLTNPAGAVYTRIAAEPGGERGTAVKAGNVDEAPRSGARTAAVSVHGKESAGKGVDSAKPVEGGGRIAVNKAVEPAIRKPEAPPAETKAQAVQTENPPRDTSATAREADKPAAAPLVEVHEGTNHNQAYNLIEDAVALLPEEMRRFLKGDMDILYGYSDIKMTTDSWKKSVIGRDSLIRKCNRISVATSEVLAEDLGVTVQYVLDVSLSAATPDPFNDVLRSATQDFLDKGNLGTYKIDYPGFRGISLDEAVDNLYALRKYDKKSVYPEMVKATADIWTAVWTKNGGKYTPVPHKIVRRP